MAVRLSAIRNGRSLFIGNISFLLLILISVKRLSKPQGLLRLEGLGKLKKCNELIGSGTRDLPACSVVPQPLSYRMLRNDTIKLHSLMY
jgi:hypothetical protein